MLWLARVRSQKQRASGSHLSSCGQSSAFTLSSRIPSVLRGCRRRAKTARSGKVAIKIILSYLNLGRSAIRASVLPLRYWRPIVLPLLPSRHPFQHPKDRSTIFGASRANHSSLNVFPPLFQLNEASLSYLIVPSHQACEGPDQPFARPELLGSSFSSRLSTFDSAATFPPDTRFLLAVSLRDIAYRVLRSFINPLFPLHTAVIFKVQKHFPASS